MTGAGRGLYGWSFEAREATEPARDLIVLASAEDVHVAVQVWAYWMHLRATPVSVLVHVAVRVLKNVAGFVSVEVLVHVATRSFRRLRITEAVEVHVATSVRAKML